MTDADFSVINQKWYQILYNTYIWLLISML